MKIQHSPSSFYSFIIESFSIDKNAADFYSTYKEHRLLPEIIYKNTINASFIKYIILYTTNLTYCRSHVLWRDIATMSERLKDRIGHTLPGNARRLREKVELFKIDGYKALVSKCYGKGNARKITPQIITLLRALNANKQFNNSTYEAYKEYVQNPHPIRDEITGEMIDTRCLYDASGNPIILSKTTINYYLQKTEKTL